MCAGDWTSPGLSRPEDASAPKFYRTPSGVRVQELIEGNGPAPNNGDTVLIDFVLRRWVQGWQWPLPYNLWREVGKAQWLACAANVMLHPVCLAQEQRILHLRHGGGCELPAT
jgi:hypothetical protein